jgi:nucleoside 2-deoxyribosyltransferase
MLIYFAGPLFSKAEQAFNFKLTEKLEASGFSVFLPQRDGIEISKPPFNEMTLDELYPKIFELDCSKILEADIFLIILDGRVPDEGACVELGIAYGQKRFLQRDKLIIGLQTDLRAAFPGAKLNAMLHGPLDQITDNENDLTDILMDYRLSRESGREKP